MGENNPNPSSTLPADKGTVHGGQADPDKHIPAAGDQPSGDDKDEQKVEISVEELNKLKRNSGRWETRNNKDRKNRRENRHKRSGVDENSDPDLLDSLKERDDKISSLTSENFILKTKNEVRNILEKEEYKDLPDSLKRAIAKNPLGFVQSDSETVEDALADIEDYLEDELDFGTQPKGDDQSSDKKPDETLPADKKDQTPPAGGSGPSSPNASAEESIEGKTGPARSTTILSNLLKGLKGNKK